MLIGLVKAGIGSVLQLPVSQKLAGSAVLRVADIVRSHFQDSSHELAAAYQESWMRAMVAIASGLAKEAELSGMWNKLKKLGESRLSQEFSSQIQKKYLEPFATRYRYRLSAEALERFRKNSMMQCKQLAQHSEKVLPLEMFAEPDWAAWANETFSAEVSELLVERIIAVETCEELLQKFLSHEGLLGDAVLHFFHERMRNNPRVEKTLAALQRERMWADLRDLQAAQHEMSRHIQEQLAHTEGEIAKSQQVIMEAMQRQNFEMVAELGRSLHELQQHMQAQRQQLSNIPKMLEEAQKAWDAVGGRLDRFTADLGVWCSILSNRLDVVMASLEELGATLDRVESGVLEIKVGVEAVDEKLVSLEQQVASQSAALTELVEMMRGLHLGIKVKARDEFSTHNQSSLRVIQQAVRVVSELPRHARGFSMAAIQVGSALSSCGNIEKSIEFLRMALENAQNEPEMALASYNLFQVYLRQQQYVKALEYLQRAVELDAKQYALHDAQKYPPKQILGAGGMGCVFLCGDLLRGEVVVKSFWESRKGPLEEVFAEVRIMAKIAGAYVPLALDYGYVDRQQQERPYIVMEHVVGVMDGEAYLEQYGPMSLVDGLKVGIQVAKGMEIAHNAGISHLDLKPANLLLQRNDGEIQVKIIDFGLSRVATSLKQEAVMVKSRSGKSVLAQEIFGTLDYAPPEQLGDVRYGQPGPHSDLFSFGATLYRLMTQEHPRIINPRRMREKPELFELISECMEQDYKQRPASATELVRRLEQMQNPQRKDLAESSSVRSQSPIAPKTSGWSEAEQARRDWEDKRLAKFTELYQAAQNLVLENAEEALKKLAEAHKLAPELCDESFPKWELYARNQRDIQREQEAKKQAEEERKALQKRQRHQKFEDLCGAGQDLAPEDPEQALQKLTEAHQFAPDLCGDTYRRWWTDIVEEQRRRQFNVLYEVAQELAQTHPEQALQKFTEAHQFAPDLCDDAFRQWRSFAEHKQSEATKPHTFLSRLVSTITGQSAPSRTRVTLLLADSSKRPEWVPKRVPRHVRKFEIPGPQRGGCLMSLPRLPEMMERKVILDRSGDPLLEMVKIPAGEFLMGSADSDSSAYGDEKPQKRIHLEDYWISRTPVTNRMWKRFLEESGYNPLQEDHDGNFLYHWSGQNPPDEKLDHPMVYVSYMNVWAFCDFYGLMLPCEAQWEKAARGSEGRIYPWGAQEPTAELCNFDGTGKGDTTSVNQYPRGMSVYGLLDCSGNVWEWCADAWDASWLQKITNGRVVYKNRFKSGSISCRGGSFSNDMTIVRSAFRVFYSPQFCYDHIGFRVAQDIR